jgi:predicted metalloprotease with PDZ domain
MPKNWQWINNFGINDSVQIIRDRSYQFIAEGLFFAGDTSAMTTRDTMISSGRVISGALQNSWSFPSQDILHLINKIVGIERDFMQSHTTASYVAMTGGIAVGKEYVLAHGYTSSFLAWLSDRADSANAPVLKHTIAHEILHTWNIGSKVKYNPETGFQLYFVEGLTDYFARKTLRKANLLTEQEYIEHYNKAIEEYYSSDYRSIRAASFGQTSSSSIPQRIAYRKGDILAHNWNREIEIYTQGKNSLDDVFRTVIKGKEQITDSSFAVTMKPYIGRDIMLDIERIMRDGGEIVPTPDALGANTALRKKAIIKHQFFVPTEWEKIPQYFLREN